MHRTSTQSPPFLKKDESIWRTLRNYTNKKEIMMKYKKLWKTMIHSLKDKCFKMHFTELQDTKRRQMTSPPRYTTPKNESILHPQATYIHTNKNFPWIFWKKCSEMFEIVLFWNCFSHDKKWPQETPLQATKSTCLDSLYLLKEKCL